MMLWLFSLSLIYIILISCIYFSKEKINNIDNKLYSSCLIVNIIGLVLDLVQLILIKINFFNVVLTVINRMFLVYIITWTFIFVLYALSIRKNPFEQKKVFIPIFIFYIISTILALVLPISLYNDGTKIYSYGMSVSLVFYVVGIFIFLIIISIIRKLFSKDKLHMKKYVPIIIFLVFGTVAGVIQKQYPELLLTTPVQTFITILTYFFIENPDVKMIEQLELAKESADKANAAKTEFLSSMSHEIRTPLNAISGFSDCIKHADSLEEAKENADDIINASNTLLEIVNGILDISKIEAGKLEIINSDYNAYDLFSGLAKLVTPKMNEKGLDFQVLIAEDLPSTLYGDSANIKKVVTNLLSNAYKYTDKGFVRYSVNCVNTDGICRLIITVEDSGRGIKKESVDKLFDKFQRVDEDRNTTIEGTGLGLAITKQLVELMGGNIVLHTVYGEGSKFTITLDQRIDNVVVENKVSASLDSIDLTGKRLLVVDDNQLNLKVATKLLERYHASVDVCDSGFACISKITNGEKYDLILMDDMMPKMSGKETFKKLKESSTFNIPVIALTANAITGMRESYLEVGFDGYLAKPIEKEEMIRVFTRIFTNQLAFGDRFETKIENTGINDTNFLEVNGIDVAHGLELLGDVDMYNSTMNDFVDEMENRVPLLQQYVESADMPNYAIIVHAIKSDCKYLGISELADLSYEHELKSKDNDLDYVNNNFNGLINKIEDYVTVCKHYLNRD